MDLSISSEEGVSLPLLDKYPSMPPAAMRSSKSVVDQVKDTLFTFLKKVKFPVAKTTEREKENENSTGESKPSIELRFSPEMIRSRSQEQRKRGAFLDRIATFSPQYWMGKPLALSPPLLSQYGWQCIGHDSIKCCSCAALSSTCLPWPDSDLYRRKCLEYRQKIISAHTKICSWPGYPCPDSFVNPFLPGGTGLDGIRAAYATRAKNLICLREKLPQLQTEVVQELDLLEGELWKIVEMGLGISKEKMTTPLDSSKMTIEITACVLSLCGWDTTSSKTSSSPSVFCKETGRTIGLWNFHACEHTTTDEEVSGSDLAQDPDITAGSKRQSDSPQETLSSKRLKPSDDLSSSPSHLKIDKSFFNPLKEHHPWSPWTVVLKPVTQDEFEDSCDVTEDNKDHPKYKFIVNPAVEDSKPGWKFVRDTLLSKNTDALPVKSNVRQTPSKNFPSAVGCGDSSKETTSPSARAEASHSQSHKTPPKVAIMQARKLLNQW